MTDGESQGDAGLRPVASAEDRGARIRAALEASFGIMQRDEPPEETVRRARESTEAMFRRNLHLWDEPMPTLP